MNYNQKMFLFFFLFFFWQYFFFCNLTYLDSKEIINSNVLWYSFLLRINLMFENEESEVNKNLLIKHQCYMPTLNWTTNVFISLQPFLRKVVQLAKEHFLLFHELKFSILYISNITKQIQFYYMLKNFVYWF